MSTSLQKKTSSAPGTSLGEQDNKWTFRYTGDDGQTHYSACMELEELMAIVERKKLEGVFCVAAIIPDFRCQAQVNFNLKESKFIK
jgi:hypothetical protein